MIEVENTKIDIGLANMYKLIPLDSEKGKEFNEYMQCIMGKMFSEDDMKDLEIDFYLRDEKDDPSIARITATDNRVNRSLKGDKFAVMINQRELQKLDYEDELAFVLGHEISHIMWEKDRCGVKSLHDNEEVACDLSSMKKMHAAGYNPFEALDINNKLGYEDTSEIAMRNDACKGQAIALFNFSEKKPLDKEKFSNIPFVRMKQKYDIPLVSDSEEIATQKMLKNLDKVYKNSDREGFEEVFKTYVEEKGSEYSSKFFLNLVAEAIEKYPLIDDEKKNFDYAKHLRHPISVLGSSERYVSNLQGKKLYPPQARAKLGKYIKDNPSYFRGMDFMWNKWHSPTMTTNNNQRS